MVASGGRPMMLVGTEVFGSSRIMRFPRGLSWLQMACLGPALPPFPAPRCAQALRRNPPLVPGLRLTSQARGSARLPIPVSCTPAPPHNSVGVAGHVPVCKQWRSL
eukprot:1388818-Heterocapsa_arctica.AAC.1